MTLFLGESNGRRVDSASDVIGRDLENLEIGRAGLERRWCGRRWCEKRMRRVMGLMLGLVMGRDMRIVMMVTVVMMVMLLRVSALLSVGCDCGEEL